VSLDIDNSAFERLIWIVIALSSEGINSSVRCK
jgi:hypothetical protein